MMMVSNGFNFPANGYYNPQPPRRQPIQPPAEPDVFHYTTVAGASDQIEFGGNGDGKLDQQELALSVNQNARAANYYRNMFQATGNIQYKQAADVTTQFFQASVNMQNEYNIFANADPNGNGGITLNGIQNIANGDGNPYDVSPQDVGLQPPPMNNGYPIPPYGQQPPYYNNQPPMNNGYPMTPYGQQPYYNNKPPYGGGYPFPVPYPMIPKVPEDLTYLQAKEDNPNAWDGKQLAVGINNRIGQLDVDGDKQISYEEAMASPDGLLGNGQLNPLPGSPESMRIWAGISGTDGKMNARELASTILSVDADSDGTVTAKETYAFSMELDQRVQDSSMAARMYDYIDQKGKRFGLDNFIAETQETKDVRTTAEASKQTEKAALKNTNVALNKTTEELTAKLKGLDPNSTEAKELKEQLINVQLNSTGTRERLILATLKEGYPEDPAGFTAEGKGYKKQLTNKATELKTKLAKLDATTPEAKTLKSAISHLKKIAKGADLPRSYGSSNLAAETRIREINVLILGKQLVKNSDPSSSKSQELKDITNAKLETYQYLPTADISKLSPEGKKLFAVGEDYMATAKQLQTADLTTPAGKALQAKLDTLEKAFIEASNFNPLPVVEPPPPPPPPLTAKRASQVLIDNFGEFESLLDTDKTKKDGIAHFNELVEYTKKADAKPEVKAAVQFFIDNRANTFDKMEGLNDNGRKDGIFSIDELRKFLAQQG
ncbi:MAG: TipAS antibiotic-recognition domain-containing protein [Vampirovibrio sp.]|nr:TipAS antibiotic-recognition domain-containing protein [Vampirovibrio sp.]